MKKNNLVLIAIMFVMMGCYSTANIYKSEKTKGTDFSKYKTYAWLATKDTAYTKLLNRKNVERALAEAVIQELTKRGMKLDTLHPDCLFTYTLVINKTYEVGQKPPEIYSQQTFAPVYPGQNNIYYYRSDYGMPAYSGGLSVAAFRDGSLVIDMVDRQNNKIVWRSSVEGKQSEDNLKGVKRTVNEVVPVMFKKFPVKPN
jgi:hypothetical protein